MSHEFDELIENKDIVCFGETKCDETFNSIKGFNVFHKPRESYKRLSGGLAICVKNYLLPYVTCIKTPSEFVLWLRVDKRILSTPNDLIIGTCYIPPENSVYANPDALDEVENELIEYFYNDPFFVLLGDFNGRTKNVTDLFTIPTHNDILPNEDTTLYVDQEDILVTNGLSIIRNSQDDSINNTGHKLIDFVKTCNFCILNGRCGIESNKLTCNNVSVVDYVLFHFDCFTCMKPYFYVSDFNNIISDVHAAIHVDIELPQPLKRDPQSITDTPHSTTHYPPRKKTSPRKWSEEKAFDFIMNLNIDKLREIREDLHHITVPDEPSVTSVVDKISSLLTSTAAAACGTRSSGLGPTNKTHTSQSVNDDDKPYYTHDCLQKRDEYHRLRKLNHDNKNDINSANMVNASKMYKKALNTAINKYKDDMQRELKATRASNPKKFWNIINKTHTDSKSTVDASPDDLFNHFKNVSTSNEYAHNRNFDLQFDAHNVPHRPSLELLNGVITSTEIADTIISLKSNKAAGDDDVINEYIKISSDLFLPIYVDLFNLILDTGIYPSSWSLGTVIPIYKGKGDPHEPKNYRPINLSSCIGKLFATILNNRLKLFLDAENKMSIIQGAFMPGSSTTKHLHALHCLIEYITANDKPMFCAFLDLSSAYDKVWRDGMLVKLINSGIGGKFFNVVQSMYKVTKMYVKCNNLMSTVFHTNIGIKQGCTLSCLIFAMFLNDLEMEMYHYGCKGTNIIDIETGRVMLKLFALLYADDTVIISDNKKDFQEALNAFSYYCRKWKLKINESKSNIIIFGKVRNRNRLVFTINGERIDIVNSFKYLGLEFHKNRRYITAIKSNLAKARRASFSIFRKSKTLNLSVSCQIHILNTIVKPILLYGCEVFCFDNFKMLETFYLQCLKRILYVKKSTSSCMVYAETGCTPLYVDVMKRSLCFYVKTQYAPQPNLASTMLYILHKSHAYGRLDSKYLQYIRNSLTEIGLPYLYYNYTPLNTTITAIASRIKRSVTDQYIQNWRVTVNTSHKAVFYRSIKHNTEFEPYLDILPKSKRIALTRFRLSNHRFPVELGSWYNIPPELRTCPICPLQIGNEFHYLFVCPSTLPHNNLYLQRYYRTRPSVHKMNELFKSTNKHTLLKLATFIQLILKLF